MTGSKQQLRQMLTIVEQSLTKIRMEKWRMKKWISAGNENTSIQKKKQKTETEKMQ